MPTKKNQPQYAVIAQALINDISRGKYPLGSLLPPELDMAEQFKVSRNTMRSALRVLVDMGLVSRRAGRGTQVQSSQIHPNYAQRVESLDVLFPEALSTDLTVGSAQNIQASAEEAMLLACPAGSPWVRFPVTRHRRKQAVSYSWVYVAPHLKQVKGRMSRTPQLSYQALEHVLGEQVHQVVQQADAAAAPADVAKALAIDTGNPVLRKATRYIDAAGRVLMATDTYTPPGHQHYTVHLRMNWVGNQEGDNSSDN